MFPQRFIGIRFIYLFSRHKTWSHAQEYYFFGCRRFISRPKMKFPNLTEFKLTNSEVVIQILEKNFAQTQIIKCYRLTSLLIFSLIIFNPGVEFWNRMYNVHLTKYYLNEIWNNLSITNLCSGYTLSAFQYSPRLKTG